MTVAFIAQSDCCDARRAVEKVATSSAADKVRNLRIVYLRENVEDDVLCAHFHAGTTLSWGSPFATL
jgi:hypothetical protein